MPRPLPPGFIVPCLATRADRASRPARGGRTRSKMWSPGDAGAANSVTSLMNLFGGALTNAAARAIMPVARTKDRVHAEANRSDRLPGISDRLPGIDRAGTRRGHWWRVYVLRDPFRFPCGPHGHASEVCVRSHGLSVLAHTRW